MQIEPNVLIALALFAAKKDIREYLKNIRVESTVLVATDGATLLAVRTAPMPGGFLIPAELIKKIKAKAGPVTVTPRALTQGGDAFQIPELAPYYPEWRRAVPKETDGQAGYYDGDLAARFEQAGRLLGLRPYISQSGTRAAIVRFYDDDRRAFSDDHFGVIMPRRCDGAPCTAPSWGRHP